MIVGSVVQRADSKKRKGRGLTVALFFLMLLSPVVVSHSATPAQGTVSCTISLLNATEDDPSNVAVWLEPLVDQLHKSNPEHLAIHQRVKEFFPHVLIATVGQQVDFPNDDPFPHNIFSNSEVKRFDLGIYQSGESRTVMFTSPGVIPIYCNIHPQMEAFIIVLQTPYYGLSDERGEVRIKEVPPGNYRLKVWHERAKPEMLEALSRQVTVTAAGANLGTIKVDESGFVPVPHKDKEGGDYNPYPNK